MYKKELLKRLKKLNKELTELRNSDMYHEDIRCMSWEWEFQEEINEIIAQLEEIELYS